MATIQQEDHVVDLIWEAVEEAIEIGWSARTFKRYIASLWVDALGAKQRRDGAELRAE